MAVGKKQSRKKQEIKHGGRDIYKQSRGRGYQNDSKNEDKRKRKHPGTEVSQKDNHVAFTERRGLEANSPQNPRVKCTCIRFPRSLSFSGILHLFPI